jgi:hypothetical protein
MAYEKTWQFDINRAYSPSTLTDMGKWVLWYYKAFLTGQIGVSGTAPTVITVATPSAAGGTLAAGVYYYRVAAIVGGVESVGSNEFTVTTTGATGSVALTWLAVTGATGYRVYRGIASGAENVFYAPGAVTTYTDTNAASSVGSPRTDKGTWWVVGSSNSTTGDNFSGTSFGHDYWASATRPETYTAANIVRNTAGSAHSWLVLRSPASVGGGKAYYLLLDWSTATDYQVTVTLGVDSPPTGGTNTTAPTMVNFTGSQLLSAVFSMSATNGPIHMHGTLATDGSFNMLMSRDATGKFISGFLGHAPANVKVNDLYPLWISMYGDSTAASGYGAVASTYAPDNATWSMMRAPDNSLGGGWAVVSPALTYLPAAPDSFDGSFIDWPCWLGASTLAYRSMRGRLQDIMFFGGGVATGSVDNPAGTPGFMVVGNYWFPTNAAPIL